MPKVGDIVELKPLKGKVTYVSGDLSTIDIELDEDHQDVETIPVDMVAKIANPEPPVGSVIGRKSQYDSNVNMYIRQLDGWHKIYSAGTVGTTAFPFDSFKGYDYKLMVPGDQTVSP